MKITLKEKLQITMNKLQTNYKSQYQIIKSLFIVILDLFIVWNLGIVYCNLSYNRGVIQ